MNQALTIYKASAGSGKTFALAIEYIMELLQEDAEKKFEQTLAVTFTNKATAEMKDRILETLYGLKTGLAETNDYLDAIKKRFKGQKDAPTEQQIRERAGKALTAILHDYSHFRVETIDSFFQSILRNMARELGLAANLQVEISTEEIIDSAVDSLIETMSEDKRLEEWVLDYVQDQLKNGEKWDIVKQLKRFAGNIFKENYQERSEEELARISDTGTVKAFMQKMRAIRKKAEEEVQKAADELVDQIISKFSFDKISYGEKYLHSFLKSARTMESDGPNATIRGQADGSKSLLLAKYQKDTNCQAIAEELQKILFDFIVLYDERYKEYLSAKLALRHLVSLRLLRDIDKRIREIENETGSFTLNSTPALLSKMVKGTDAPFIFEKIGTIIDNVMIDEFQDTSRLQWENFRTLLHEKLASGGKGMLFGDIKQSIYRWRNGDWRILYELAEELKAQGIKPESLDTNYRSHQIIVDFNNDFFPKAAEQLDAIKPDAEIKLSRIYEDVKQKKKKEDGKGHVRIKLYKEKAGDNTIQDMVEQIQSLQAGGLDLSEIAILVRKNDLAQQIIEGFAQYAPDIKLVSGEAFMLGASVSVQMIVAAMRLLIDKNHKDVISEKYLMLHYLQDVLGQKEATIQSVAQQKASQVLPEEFTKNRGELLQMPLYLLGEKLWSIFSLNNIQGEDIYMLTFFDELQKHLRTAIAPDIQTFLEAWDEELQKKSIPSSAVPGVRILTIHKSKGLAFHTVMLPFCEWPTEKNRQTDVLWCSTKEKPYNELGALPISIYAADVRTSVFAPAYEEEHLERRVDALNTLYVAFTRAKANLYIWGNLDTHEKNTAANLIFKSLRTDDNDKDEVCFTYEVGSPLTETKKEDEKKNRLSLQHRMEDAVDVNVVTRDPKLYFLQSNLAQDYMRQMAANDGQQIADMKLSQREVGERMHEVLSRVSDVSQLEEVLSQARKEGLIGAEKDWDVITIRIEEGFSNPHVASWFKAGNTVYNECSIAGINDEGQPDVLRPDRVVINGNCITVIDYKFGRPSSYYATQVETYMDFMRRMYPNHEVKGYLWYIMSKEVFPVSNSK